MLTVPKGRTIEQMVAAYKRNPNVAFAEPDYTVSACLTPNDPYCAGQWGLPIVNAPAGWDIATGSTTLKSALDYASSRGVVLVAAMGNSATSAPFYPAAYPNAIGVGSTSKAALSSFSNYGTHAELVAPGESIHSTFPGNRYERLSGTSMATPFVSGLAALMLGVDPSLKSDALRTILRQTASDMGDVG